MKRLILLIPLLLLGACALFQQVPGRVVATGFTTEAGAVYGETTAVPGGCPSIRFGGAQNVGEVTATCTDGGRNQSLSAKTVDANSVLASAIAGQTALGQQMSAVAQSIIALLGAAKTGATGGLGASQPGPMGATSGPTPNDCAAVGRTFVITAAGTLCQ